MRNLKPVQSIVVHNTRNLSSRAPKLTLYTEAVSAGVGRYTYELAQALIQTGADAQLLAPALPWEEDHPFLGKRRVFLPTPQGKWRPCRIASLIRRAVAGLANAFRIGRCEPIVFSHLVGVPPFSMLGLWGAKLAGARCALLLHDFYPHQLRFPRLLQPLERFLYRGAYRTFDLVVALTDAQRAQLRAIGVRPDAIAHIPHGVFPLGGVRSPRADGPLTLLVFGSLRQNKQIQETVRAIQKLRRRQIEVELIIAGSPGREDALYWSDCLDVVRSAPQGIEVLDRFIEEEELAGLLSRVHAFICPYKNFDSQSGVAMLALSNGIPLIATATVGIPAEMGPACQMIAPNADTDDIEAGIRAFQNEGVSQMQVRAADTRDQLLRDRSWIIIAETLTARLTQSGFFSNRDEHSNAAQVNT